MNKWIYFLQLFDILRLKNRQWRKKKKVIIDIRKLNAIIQSNAYSLFLQSDIITVVRNYFFISIINAFVFFYQWRVHLKNRHKFIVVIHRNQKSFNVTMMSYKNSSIYVQRQINRLLRHFWQFFKIYIDDIVIFFKTTTKHVAHLRSIFDMLRNNNIFIKFNKTFLKYSFVQLLDQKIDFFEFFISEEKLRAIVKLFFSKNFRLLKTYFDMIDWLREYIFFYVDIFKSLQKRKTKLLKFFFKIDNIRKTFSTRTRLNNFIF